MSTTAAQREYREEYLSSAHWQTMRRLALDAADHRCQVCAANSRLDVHHRTYARRGAERLTDLTVLCRSCHDLFHSGGTEAAYSRATREREMAAADRLGGLKKVAPELEPHYLWQAMRVWGFSERETHMAFYYCDLPAPTAADRRQTKLT